ncbi:MAG: LysR family transcriptional regulator [Pseudonocardiaceae bacterium]
MSGPAQHQPSDPVAGLLGRPSELLDLTFDQLRTLVMVRLTGNALRAARALGREQSSVQKQLTTLNELAQRMVGEVLALKQRRGQDFLFTPTGDQVTDLAAATLEGWSDVVHSARRRLGSTITVGTTEFTIRFLGEIWPHVRDDFQRRGIELKIVHVRTRDFWATLDAQQVDLICGSFATEQGQLPDLDYDFIECGRERVALLSNLTARELPDRPVRFAELPKLPLLAPTAGLLAEFLRRWYGPDYRATLTVIADIDALNYGLGLLQSQLLHGCLITTHAVAEAAITGRLPGGEGLRMIELGNDYRPCLELVTGVFGRRREREHYASDHPLNILWQLFETHASDGTDSRPDPAEGRLLRPPSVEQARR